MRYQLLEKGRKTLFARRVKFFLDATQHEMTERKLAGKKEEEEEGKTIMGIGMHFKIVFVLGTRRTEKAGAEN